MHEKMVGLAAIPTYRITTVEKPPFVMWNATTGEWRGFCIDMLGYLSGMIGFDYTIEFAPDGISGSINEAGTWDGMINELKKDRADIALGGLTISSEREAVVDFTMPFYEPVGFLIMMKKVKEKTSLFRFANVLGINVWLCIFGSFLVTGIFVWLFDLWSPFSYQNNPTKIYDDDDKRVFGLKESLWFTLTSITPQGGGEAPKCLSGRLVASTWWLFGFIVLASYTANLAAFLTISRLEIPIESLDDLLHQHAHGYGPIQDSEAEMYFRRMAYIEERFYEVWKALSLDDNLSFIEEASLAVWDYPISDKYTRMLEWMRRASFPENVKEAVYFVEAVNYAWIGDANDIRYVVRTNCQFKIVGDEFSKKPYGIAVQKGSPLKDKLDQAIIKLSKDGILEKLKNQWWNEKINIPRCPREYKISDGITIDNIGGVFVILILGIIAAIGTLSVEFWWFRCWLPRKHCRRVPKEKKSKSNKPMKFTVKPAGERSIFGDSARLKKRF